ncbi:MAG: transketolase family protein [Gaiellaceae bacterium]
MRTSFIDELCNVADDDERVWLACGDLGYSVLEQFADRFPERFVNIGVAEQNMIGVAAGLAMDGRVVFTYSIANFATMRCLEQIRNDVCYHGLDVKVVSVGGGLAYGPAGYTHHAVEDVAVLRALPNMTVVAPGDPVEARLAVRALVDRRGPAYLRLGKAGEPILHAAPPAFELGRALMLREGADLTLIAAGGILQTAVEAADLLAESGVSARVLSMHTVKPLDAAAITAACRETELVCVVEEHGDAGGLSDAVARVLAETGGCRGVFLTVDVAALFGSAVGSQRYLADRAGLSPAAVAARAAAELDRCRASADR